MAHDSPDFTSPQEAIEGYLEALLQDVAEYDEPETSEPEVTIQQQEKKSRVEAPSRSPDISARSKPAEQNADEAGTRVFAPPSAREYAREAATQIRQRQQIAEATEPKVDIAFQEAPAVVMPELKIAEPEIETQIETEIPEPVIEIEPEVSVPEVEVEPEVFVADVEDVAQESATDLQPAENEGWTNGRPDWAQGRFECLLFVVKGLKLAVPLAELGGIHKLEKDPTPLFGQPSWFLGIVRANNMNVGLVDTAQWVMSEHIKDDHKPDFRFAIRIHNSEWGLACHEVAEAISLHPDEVKWRTSLGRRPWLAGTVVDHMCALIDVAAFARLLDSDKVPVDLQALMSDEE